MTPEEILELIRQGENSGVEFKRDELRREQLAREVVAFANFQGGRILIGVEDDGTISGIQRENLEHWVMDTVFGHTVHPQLLPYYETVRLDNGKQIAVVTVLAGTAKPYVVRHHHREDIYIRVGSTSQLATREQQAALFASGGLLHAELLPISGSALVDFDQARLTDYLGRVLTDEVPQDEQAWLDRLCGLGFMMERTNGPPVCTIAGAVLFAHRPRRLLRQAGLRWMAFSGDEMDYQSLDDRVLDAPLVGLWSISGANQLFRAQDGLIEAFMERALPFFSEETTELVEHLRRERYWFYPPDAVRESLLNAFAHRDWTRPAKVEAVRYGNRFAVTSPGALQNAMTVEKMLAGQRSARNPIIVEVLRDYGYVDARGMGIRRKIVPLVRQATGHLPGFDATEDFLRITLPASGTTKDHP